MDTLLTLILKLLLLLLLFATLQTFVAKTAENNDYVEMCYNAPSHIIREVMQIKVSDHIVRWRTMRESQL